MKNFVQKGEAITVPSPIVTVAGVGIQVGELFGVASASVQPGEPVSIATTGVYELEKETADSFAIGDPVYFDDSTLRVTETDTGNLKIGHAVTAAGNPSSTVNVRLSV